VTAIEMIKEERDRQLSSLGITFDHDDSHVEGELAYAAACYALYHGYRTTFPSQSFRVLRLEDQATKDWPWEQESWKPSDDPVRNLVKAGALIAAEIERLQRALEKGKR